MITVNNIKIERFNFPGGECQVRLASAMHHGDKNITAFLRSSDDIIDLLLTVDAIRRADPIRVIRLCLPYLPYARQDRVCSRGEAFSLSVMANLINSLKCEKVILYDPHSSVASALINNCMVKSLRELIEHTDTISCKKFKQFIKDSKLKLVSPDAGAEKKVIELAKMLDLNEVTCASKVRDVKTGDIKGIKVYANNVLDQKLLVVDDICDGGRTFIELAKELKDKGASKLYLYVTHGIFSKGLTELLKYYDHIWCYHTFLEDKMPDGLTVLCKENFNEN
jgi:ribose-phosphate pyrophosphokinase